MDKQAVLKGKSDIHDGWLNMADTKEPVWLKSWMEGMKMAQALPVLLGVSEWVAKTPEDVPPPYPGVFYLVTSEELVPPGRRDVLPANFKKPVKIGEWFYLPAEDAFLKKFF